MIHDDRTQSDRVLEPPRGVHGEEGSRPGIARRAELRAEASLVGQPGIGAERALRAEVDPRERVSTRAAHRFEVKEVARSVGARAPVDEGDIQEAVGARFHHAEPAGDDSPVGVEDLEHLVTRGIEPADALSDDRGAPEPAPHVREIERIVEASVAGRIARDLDAQAVRLSAATCAPVDGILARALQDRGDIEPRAHALGERVDGRGRRVLGCRSDEGEIVAVPACAEPGSPPGIDGLELKSARGTEELDVQAADCLGVGGEASSKRWRDQRGVHQRSSAPQHATKRERDGLDPADGAGHAHAQSMLFRKLSHLAWVSGTQWIDADRLRALRRHRLRRVLRAAMRTAFYREHYREAGTGPRDVRELEDLARLPTIVRADLIDNYPHRITTRPVGERDVLVHTSGSSGTAMEVAHAPHEHDFLDAIYARALFATGYRPWERMAYFWWTDPVPATRYERLGLMRKHRIGSDGDASRQLEQLLRVRPTTIYHFPTSMVALARELGGRRPPELSLRRIICHGELMTEDARAIIGEAFGCPVFDQYGAQEVNRIGWDCAHHRGMHLDAESVLMEVLRADGTPAEIGEEGDVVLTSLSNTLMPIVRYRVGDIGRLLGPGRCACGRTLPMFELTAGRADDHLVLASGRRVQPRRIVSRLERYVGFKQFRVVQLRADRVEILIVERDDPPPSLRDDLVRELRALVDDPKVEILCRAVPSIPLGARGKLRCVERQFR